MQSMRQWVVAAIAAAAVAACGGDRGDQGAAADSTAAATPEATAPTSGALTDPQIAQIALVANSADSAGGVAAEAKATNPDVKNFAQTMVTDHGNANKEATALATKLNVTPQESDASRNLQQDATSKQQDLASKTGADFDKAYIDNEVEMHQKVLDTLDKDLIPNAQNAELKALLTKVRGAVDAHLQRAKQIQGRLNQSA